MIREYLNNYKEEFKKCINDLKHINTIYKQVPNLLTLSRVVGMIPVNILILSGNVIPGIILITLLLGTDFVDGKFARKYGVESKFGADLDAICDKIMVLGLVLPLIINNPVLVANLALEGIISIINVSGRIKGLDTKTVKAGKIKTWFLSGTIMAGYLSSFFGLSQIILAFLSCMTIGAQIITIDRYVEEYKKMKKRKTVNTIFQEVEIEENDNAEMIGKNLEKELIRERDNTFDSCIVDKVKTRKRKIGM